MQPIRENVNIDIMCESQPNFKRLGGYFHLLNKEFTH